MAPPDQYLTELVGIVPWAPPAPLVKLVEDTVAVHVRSVPVRESSTVTVPSEAEKVFPEAPDCVPRLALDGTLMPRVSARMLNVPSLVETVDVVRLAALAAVVVVVRLTVVLVVLVVVVELVLDVLVVEVDDVVVVDGLPFAAEGAAVTATRAMASARARRSTPPLSVIQADLARSRSENGSG